MTAVDFVEFGSYSVYFALLIALIRLRKIHKSFRPFVIIIVVGALMETISFVLINLFNKGNAVTINLFSLVEALLWIWQFWLWNQFADRKRMPVIIASALTLLWLVENIILGKINTFSSLYSIIASFVLVFLAINEVNKLIVEEKRSLLKNAVFLICSGIIIFYTYRIFVESFYLFEMKQSNAFLLNVFLILSCVNIFVNLLFAIATIWIPTRQRFSLPYS